ncbi:MAG TPA: phosphatidylethanolamine N-methyltransferase family protein [Anaerolineae bacterium]|nr:phosphatidylethanolamine N-methyltransferase family protein [Anaerolineae bacterium]HQI84179.1 phosphatidylethanolamine N-methyltransferase family protein [Anaerolineae bacterium]
MATKIILCLTLGAETLALLASLFSALFPKRQLWPPSHRRAWQAYVMWALFIASGAGVIALGLMDWDANPLAPWLQWAVGAPLWVGGGGLALWATQGLGLAPTLGDAQGLTQRGPYRFSRNPQYVGYSVSLIGWAMMTSSTLTFVAAAVGIGAFIVAPFAEEPWLLKQYGSTYEAYMRAVPRFVGMGNPRKQ